MSDTTMRRIAEEDVRFKSYVNLLLCSLKSRYESDGILRVERYWTSDQQVETSQQDPLHAAIEVFANMDKDALQRACQCSKTKIEVVIKIKGGYTEL